MYLSELKPLQKNPFKSRGDKQIEAIGRSIQEFEKMMEIRKIVIDEDYNILGGNKRYFALKALGRVEIPDSWVDRVEGLTEAQKREFIVKDNAHWGSEWDMDILNDWGVDIEDWGVEVDWEPDKPEASEDDYEIPDEIVTDIVVGDLFEIGVHRLVCGDSTDKETVERLMRGEKADMVFTDPPYGIDVVNESGKVGGGTKEYPTTKFNKIIGDDTTNTARDFYNNCIAFGFEKFIIFGGNYFTDFLFPNRCWIVWFKNHVTERTFSNCELAWTNIDHNSKAYQVTWDGYTKEGESGSKIHPSQKPIKLCFDILNDFTKEENVIFDGFLGSGTTMVAAHQLNRRCFGLELEPRYCEVIIQRMRKLDPGIEIKKNGEIMEFTVK